MMARAVRQGSTATAAASAARCHIAALDLNSHVATRIVGAGLPIGTEAALERSACAGQRSRRHRLLGDGRSRQGRRARVANLMPSGSCRSSSCARTPVRAVDLIQADDRRPNTSPNRAPPTRCRRSRRRQRRVAVRGVGRPPVAGRAPAEGPEASRRRSPTAGRCGHSMRREHPGLRTKEDGAEWMGENPFARIATPSWKRGGASDEAQGAGGVGRARVGPLVASPPPVPSPNHRGSWIVRNGHATAPADRPLADRSRTMAER